MLALLDDALSCRDGTFRSASEVFWCFWPLSRPPPGPSWEPDGGYGRTSSKDADWSPDPTTQQSFLWLVHFHERNSPLIRSLGRHV